MRPKTSPETCFNSLGLRVRRSWPRTALSSSWYSALGQHAAQALVVRLDGLHRTDDGFWRAWPSGNPTRWSNCASGRRKDCALLGEIFLGERPFLAGAGGYAGLDIVLHR